MSLTLKPLTPERWPDLEAIFNARGCSIARGCWCLYYRRSGSQPAPPAGQTRGQANKAELRRRVKAGEFIGLIGYRGAAPVGWISFGPRADFHKLERSPVMKAVDDKPVWSIVCFVVGRKARGQGVAEALLAAAVDYARDHGARLLEAYPVDTGGGRVPSANAFNGTLGMFERAGFRVVERRQANATTKERPIVRRALRGRAGSRH